MKTIRRTLLALTVLFIIIIPFAVSSVVGTDSTLDPEISVVQSGTANTSTITLGSSQLYTTFKLDIRIDNAHPIYGWYLPNVTWNASVLQLTKVQEGPYLADNTGSGSSTPSMVGNTKTNFDNINGFIQGGLSEALSTNDTSIDSSGVLAILTFNVTNFGTSTIAISGGYTLPYAWVPGDHPKDNVTCNSATIVITNAPPSPSLSPSPSPASGGNLQNSTIELFTDKAPIDAGIGGTYGPQDLIQIYALVNYQGNVLPNQDVLFSVKNSNGTSIAIRDGKTNDSGVAHVEYRLPAADPNASEVVFGTWSITASFDISQVTVTNTTKFTFNYLSNIEKVTIPATINKLETFPIELTIDNGLFSAPCSELDITIFDQANIPIGSYTYINTQQMQNFTVIDVTIQIPSWAFTGQAKACINLLSSNGAALAPETVVNFEIQP